MRQKEEMNLVIGNSNNVRSVGETSAIGEQSNQFTLRTNNEGTKVMASGERTGVLVVGVDHGFNGVKGAEETVVAFMRFKPTKIQTSKI
jgi:hypothetical protein